MKEDDPHANITVLVSTEQGLVFFVKHKADSLCVDTSGEGVSIYYIFFRVSARVSRKKKQEHVNCYSKPVRFAPRGCGAEKFEKDISRNTIFHRVKIRLIA